jgi:eukaryotic-like serine/threonine-protein kinase
LIPLCERTVIAGKYRLERELASGGMGSVWVARHLQLDELVAVKFMSDALPALGDARARFAREARAAALLRSPHVVAVLDHGVDDDVPYIVMELLSGEHLGDRLKRVRRLPLREASSIAAQVGKALGRAHRAGIIHRDLKPANVFLARDEDEDIVKLLDFGIAKTQFGDGTDTTTTDVLMGSPQYMSPEQARGQRSIDHRADLWSLGAILFRAVTGVPAFEGATAVDVIVQICTGPIPVASRAAPGVPPAFDGFFRKALARERERRFSSAREMTEAFAAVVDTLERDDPEGALFPSGPPRPRIDQASPAEIDAFVELAFDTLQGDGADGVPPTTRCTPGRSSPPPSPSPASPSPLMSRLSGLRSLGGEPRERAPDAVAVLIDEGFSALRRGDPGRARRAWQEALDREPGNRMLALNLRRLDAMGETAPDLGVIRKSGGLVG